MKGVEWAEAAVADLNEIKAYLTLHYSPAMAQHTIDVLILAADWLLEFPQAGPLLGYRRWRKWKPRKVRHLLIYEPDPLGISVVRVRHERNDWRPVPD